MFHDLMGKIFAHANAPAAPQPATANQEPTPVPDNAPEVAADPAPGAGYSLAPSEDVAAAPATDTVAVSAEPVDVAAILGDLAKKNPEKLDWKRSIVDMLKLLGMDSGLSARKQLAHELGYSGSEGDSAAMNEWLHKAVMQKLAENGGKVPADLLD